MTKRKRIGIKGRKRAFYQFVIKDVQPPTHPISGVFGKTIIVDSRGFYICPKCMFGFRRLTSAKYHAKKTHPEEYESNDKTKA